MTARSALISPDQIYRYRLERSWSNVDPLLGWCMLNPSTADASVDDPTIRRCVRFSKDRGYGGIVVVNLMAYRASSPLDLLRAQDPRGPLNDEALREAAFLFKFGSIVCAWGLKAPAGVANRALKIFDGVSLLCLGLTKEGHPKHPLYVRADQPFIPYRPF